VEVESDFSDEGKVAIPLKKLLDITNEISSGDIQIEVLEYGKVMIKCINGNYTIMGKPADEFPASPSIDEYDILEIPTKDLARIIDHTLYAVSRDELKPALQGVLFEVENNNLRAVATDGHRLVRMNLPLPVEKEKELKVIIPYKFLNAIRGELPEDEILKLHIGKNHVQVEIDHTVISTRIITERYPDYDSVIPQDNDKKLIVSRSELLSSVKRVAIFSNRATKQITLTLEDGKILVSTEDPENITTGNETIECQYDGESITVGYNADYLKEVLLHQPGDDIQLTLRTPISAGIFTPVNDNDDILTLLMPIRIGD
jgi:DNA polymerase-3 subunit beta